MIDGVLATTNDQSEINQQSTFFNQQVIKDQRSAINNALEEAR
jgi:hypothetical protein